MVISLFYIFQSTIQLTRKAQVPSEVEITSYYTKGMMLEGYSYYVIPTLLYAGYIILRVLHKDIRWSQGTLLNFVTLCLVIMTIQSLDWGFMGLICVLVGIYIHGTCLEYPHLPVNNKAILVTGCDRGIGHELARKLDSMGFKVFAGCLFMEEEGERELRKSCSSQLTTLKLDVSDSTQVREAAVQVSKELGDKKLWGIVNNAGICYIGHIETMTDDDIQKVLAVNFLGPINVCRAFLPLLRRGKGRLVNVASNAGLAPVPLMGIYCASKSALATMTEVWRYELKAWGIKVSTIVPSGYKTGILGYDRKATAERWWRSASDVVKQDYGRECFLPKFKQKNHESYQSADLSPIVNTMVEALTSKYPRSLYHKGFLAKTLPFLYLHLPTCLGDLVMKLIADWFEFQPQALQRRSQRA